jgi:DNA polymerase
MLVASDFTAIEAVVIAALANEKWRLDVFRNRTDIYLESIGRSTGTPVAEMVAHKERTGQHHPLRQKGKIQELSLGFGGWIGALRAFGAEGTDDELKAQVLAWRAASPAIVELLGGQTRDFGRTTDYFGMEGASVQAMLNPSTHQYVMRLDGTWTGLSYLLWEGVLYLSLPSGRHIAYHQPKLSLAEKSWRGYRLTFWGWNTNPKKGMVGWIQMDLYGGLDAENATQAVARDIQRHAINTLEANGYPVVLHVYDEDVSETTRDVAGLEAIMSTMPPWAEGWPIRASGGWRGLRYRKD